MAASKGSVHQTATEKESILSEKSRSAEDAGLQETAGGILEKIPVEFRVPGKSQHLSHEIEKTSDSNRSLWQETTTQSLGKTQGRGRHRL